MSNAEACALIIDDEPDIRELLAITISRMGLDHHTAANLREARNLLTKYTFDVCLTDMRLPDGNGVEFVHYLQQHYPTLPVAVITAHGNMEAAVGAMKNGAFDFVSKPVDIQQLRTLITGAIASGRRATRVTQELSLSESGVQDKNPNVQVQTQAEEQEKNRENRALDTSALIGNSASMMQLRHMIGRVSRSNAPVWITGESGTGKELIAKLIHQNSARSAKAFVPINCGAIPSELMESELFGHKKGSFTGAINDNDGLFRRAAGGTLFLDEVAELPLAMQVKLLRAIQEKTIRPVGSGEEIKVDVRILSASHRDLACAVQEGEFRHDLYYRLNVINVRSPSLRERPEDIPALAEHILEKLSYSSNGKLIALSQGAINSICEHPFPGNVRELENVLERAVAMIDDDVINQYDLLLPSLEDNVGVPDNTTKTTRSSTFSAAPASNSTRTNITLDQERERILIIEALQANRWNRKATAAKLGMTYRQLRYRISQFGIDKTG